MISKIQPEGITLTYQCESSLQFKGKQEQIEFYIKKYFNLQQAQVKQLLQVLTYTKKQENGNGRSPFEVTYNCDSSAKTLQQILQDQLKEEQKIQYFCKLIELAQILKKYKIIHLNMKLSNVLWNKDQFYVIDFGYFNTSPSSFVINQNFGQYAQHNDNKRYLYPYLTHEFLNWVKDYLGNIEVIEKYVKTQTKEKLLKIDQYALGIMMLELFVPLEKIYKNFEIQTCIGLANKKNREEQLKRIKNLQQNYGTDTVENIHKIISDILFKDQLPSDQDLKLLKENFEKQQIINNQQRQNTDQFQPIDQNCSQILNQSLVSNDNSPLLNNEQQTLQQKMIPKNKDYIQQLIQEDTYEFDPNLLYYLNQKELHHFKQKIEEQSHKLMYEKANHILRLLSKDYLKKQNYKEFSTLSNEDKYYILQTYLNGKNEINDQVKEQIQQLNSIKEDQFKFNQINIELTKKNKQDDQNKEKQDDQIEEQQDDQNEEQYDQTEENQHDHNREQNQDDDQNKGKKFPQMVQKQIPNIERFIKFKSLLQIDQHYQQWNKVFENNEVQEDTLNNKKIISVKIEDQLFSIVDSRKTLYIGDIQQNFREFKDKFQDRAIEQTNNGEIIEYEGVTVNLDEDQKSGDNVTVTTYGKHNFERISIYKGPLEKNQKNGEGQFIDWKNNYFYKGNWENDKKVGKGTLKILNTEYQQIDEFIELEGIFLDDQIESVTDIKFLPNSSLSNMSKTPQQQFDYSLKLCSYSGKHFVKQVKNKNKFIDCFCNCLK